MLTEAIPVELQDVFNLLQSQIDELKENQERIFKILNTRQ
jgi:hypothetical protein